MLPVRIESVNFDYATQMGVVVLSDETSQRIVPIWVGLFEAQAILFKLKGSSFARPLTHDLLKNCIETLNGKVEFVYINEISQNTFFAEIHISQNGEKITIDSRPSDAIALALRSNVPVYVSEKVFEISSVDKEEFLRQQKENQFRYYLETLDNDDFGKFKH